MKKSGRRKADELQPEYDFASMPGGVRGKYVQRNRTHPPDKCSWCRNPDESIHRRGLCRHCYHIDLRYRKLGPNSSTSIKNDWDRLDRDWDWKTAQKQRELAISEGRRYGDIENEKVDSIRIEFELSCLGKYLLKKDRMFHGYAALFDDFTNEQKQELLHILARLITGYERRHRHRIAMALAFQDLSRSKA